MGLNSLYALVVGLYYFIQVIVFKQHYDFTVNAIILLSVVTVIADNLSYIPRSTFTANLQQARVDVPEMFRGIGWNMLRLGTAVVGFYFLAMSQPWLAISLSTTQFATSVLLTIIYFWMLGKVEWGRFNPKLAREYFTISWPIILVIATNSFLMYYGKVLLATFEGTDAVGLYGAGERVSGFVRIIAVSIGSLFFPLFSRLLNEGNFEKISSNIRKFERFTLLFIWPVVMLTSLFAHEILLVIVGQRYMGAVPILEIDAIGVFVLIFLTPSGNVLMANGNFRSAGLISVCHLGLFLSLTVAFLSPIGLNLGPPGLALAVLCTNMSLGITYVLVARRFVPNVRQLSDRVLIAVAFGLGALTFALHKLVTHDALLPKLGVGVAFLALFYGILLLSGQAKAADFELVTNVLSPAKMKAYVKGDLKKKKDDA